MHSSNDDNSMGRQPRGLCVPHQGQLPQMPSITGTRLLQRCLAWNSAAVSICCRPLAAAAWLSAGFHSFGPRAPRPVPCQNHS